MFRCRMCTENPLQELLGGKKKKKKNKQQGNYVGGYDRYDRDERQGQGNGSRRNAPSVNIANEKNDRGRMTREQGRPSEAPREKSEARAKSQRPSENKANTHKGFVPRTAQEIDDVIDHIWLK